MAPAKEQFRSDGVATIGLRATGSAKLFPEANTAVGVREFIACRRDHADVMHAVAAALLSPARFPAPRSITSSATVDHIIGNAKGAPLGDP